MTMKPLTYRQCQVIRLFTDGLTQREIARQLNLSEDTVNTYIRDIYQTLDLAGPTADRHLVRLVVSGRLDLATGAIAA